MYWCTREFDRNTGFEQSFSHIQPNMEVEKARFQRTRANNSWGRAPGSPASRFLDRTPPQGYMSESDTLSDVEPCVHPSKRLVTLGDTPPSSPLLPCSDCPRCMHGCLTTAAVPAATLMSMAVVQLDGSLFVGLSTSISKVSALSSVPRQLLTRLVMRPGGKMSGALPRLD